MVKSGGDNQDESIRNHDNYVYNHYVSPPPSLEDKYTEFLKTEPPRFSNTTDPMEADD
jgi:hypothetical protein